MSLESVKKALLKLRSVNLLLVLLVCSGGFGQSFPDAANERCELKYDSLTEREVYIYAQKMPEYRGGNEEIRKFFLHNFQHPDQDIFQASFHLEFIVNERGEVEGPRIRDKSMSELTLAEKEILKVLTSMPPWNAGECESKKVSVLVSLPLHIDFD